MEVLNMPLGTFLFFYVLFAVEIVLVVALGIYWYKKDSNVDPDNPEDVKNDSL